MIDCTTRYTQNEMGACGGGEEFLFIFYKNYPKCAGRLPARYPSGSRTNFWRRQTACSESLKTSFAFFSEKESS